MADILGAIVVIIGISAVVVIRQIITKSNKTKGYGWRQNIFVDLKTGVQCDIEQNYLNPYDIIHSNPNNGMQKYIHRNPAFMDKGEKKIELHDYWDSKGTWDGWRFILNNTNVIVGEITEQVKLWKSKWIEQKAELDSYKAENLKLRSLMKSEKQQDIALMVDTHNKMLPYFQPKKK